MAENTTAERPGTPEAPRAEYDLVILGSGPAGQKAALAAAKNRYRVALVERREVVGGVCLHTGTIPSKTLREAVLYFSGHRLHSLYGESYRLKERITTEDLTFRVQHVVRQELDVIANQMKRNGVDMYFGAARFDSPRSVVVETEGGSTQQLSSKHFLIAVGTSPARPAEVPFTPGRVMDSDGILELESVPRSMVVVGGGVIGFPSLASTSMEQGRLAACHAFGIEAQTYSAVYPYGIYTIPEISMVGETEQSLTQARVPYEFGIARYDELAKGHMIGDLDGMLKLLFHRDSLKLLGVHAIGERATELIHIGQAVMAYDGKIDYFVNTVFNYPTLAEAYKVAAFDGVNKL